MQNEPSHQHPAHPARDESEQARPPVTRWIFPAPRLQGVRFHGPLAKVTTATTPLRPPRVA